MARNHSTERAQAAGSAQKTLVAAMLDPAFYPNRPEEIRHRETHISHVFIAGALVYKIKKPVRFPFLDFSTAAKRRYFLDAEMRLNRRLAPSIYLGVVPICREPDGWRLEGSAPPCEHALLMRRLPEKRMLDYLLATGQATGAMMEQLADHLAAFHENTERVSVPPADRRVAIEWQKNLAELEPLLPERDRGDWASIGRAGEKFLRHHGELLARRSAGGWVRDGHGDLHAEHVCFAAEGIHIFDCIEFNDELRRCDLASEIAFLLMDLSVRGGEALRAPFLRRYLSKLADPDMLRLLPFYECYRALVRAKVHALRAGRWNDQAACYFEFARRFKWQGVEPFILLVSGFTGSGKSTLARALGVRLGTAVINSDEVRKRITNTAGAAIVPLNQGIYSAAVTMKTYDAMAVAAEQEISGGRSVILDGTFGLRAQREALLALAASRNIPLFVVRCSASDSTTAERLRSRAAAGETISDGRWEIYVAQKAAYESLDDVPPADRLELGTEASPDSLVKDVEAFVWAGLHRERQA